MSTIEFQTPTQFIRDVKKWMKANDVTQREMVKLSGKVLSTIWRAFSRPNSMDVKTVVALQKAVSSYKPSGASRTKENPVSRVSRRGSP